MPRTRRTVSLLAGALAVAGAAPLMVPRFSSAQTAPAHRAAQPAAGHRAAQPAAAHPHPATTAAPAHRAATGTTAHGAATGTTAHGATGSSAAPGSATPPGSSPMPASAPVQAPRFTLERYTLPNGLQVILQEDHRTPNVAVNVWYHVGSKDEPAHRNGFAHLFEHLMFQGSRHVAEDTFFLNLERVGASGINGTTNTDRTNYFELVPSGRLNLALWLESDRMAYLLDHVNQETFESQRQVVLNERRQSYENQPYGNVLRYLHEALYPESHPYHLLTIGTPEDLGNASLDDVRAFFRTWYLPNNATLVITGNFQPAEARALIERYFAPISRGPDVPRQPPPPTVHLEREVRIDVDAGVIAPRIFLAYPTPSYFQPGDAELDMVATVLTNGHNSRLYRRLVHELQVAQDVNAAQWSRELGSVFMVIVTVQPGHAPAEVLAVLDEEIARLQATPPDAAEVARARVHFEADTLFEVEGLGARADRFNFYNQYVGDPTVLGRDLARYQQVSAQDLSTAARTYLPANGRVVVLAHPTPGAPLAGRIHGAPPEPTPPAPQPSQGPTPAPGGHQ